MTSLVSHVSASLERAPVHELVDTVLQALQTHDVQADIWLADYPQQLLRSLRTGGTAAVDGSWLGRCFASQTPELQEDRRAVPMTVRGDRVGVLEAEGGCPVEELRTLAALLAQSFSAIGTTTTLYESRRRSRELTVAAELQWALLPGQSYQDADVAIAGLLEPAFSIAGDAYDWSRDHERVQVAVLDGTGRGVPAALATTLALGSLRNARFTGGSLADQAALADQAVHSHYGGEVFISALLLQLDVASGRATVIDAGSPLVYRQRAGQVEQVTLDAQLPLGMFEETIYDEQLIDLVPGDRLLVVSDGVHATQLEGQPYSAVRLVAALREARLLSPPEVCRHVVRQLRAAWGDEGPDDDAAVLCIDWLGEAVEAAQTSTTSSASNHRT